MPPLSAAPAASVLASVKVTTVGNSLGIVLPRELLQRLRVEKGDHLYLVETRSGVQLVPYDPRLLEQIAVLERVARAERALLRGLASRESGALPAPPSGPAPSGLGEDESDV